MKRETYTPEQLQEYFEHISLPAKYHTVSVSTLDAAAAMEHLKALQKYHLCAVPFENLVLHYSLTHQNNIHPQALFKKIVQTDRRGGYCMENNTLFGTVLRSMGFKMYSAGGRVKMGPAGYGGWNHMVNLVTLGGKKYLVDVGFGGKGLTHPKALEHDVVSANITPASARLTLKNIDDNTDENQKLWVYEHRINDDADWEETYCFTETEFLPNDFNMINYYTGTNRAIFFSFKVVVTRAIMDAQGEIEGILILTDALKKRVHGETEQLQEINTEDDRIAVLKEYFGIHLSEEEQGGIKGTASELTTGFSI